MSSEEKIMTAELLYDLQVVSDPQLSPDGRQIIFGVQWVDRTTEKKHSNLWLVGVNGEPARQFTYGKQSDRHARWSPDGRFIAFVSNRLDEKQEQLFLLPFFGGEARPLTDLKGSIAGFEWSPDGQRLVMQFRQKDAELLEREADEAKKKLGVVARHITSLEYKLNGSGYLPQEKWHIWTVNTEDGALQQLTEGDYSELSPRWSPDGSQILFLSNRSEDPAKEIDAVDLYLIAAGGGEPTKIETRYGRKMLASFSPDGKSIAYLGREQTGRFYQNTSIFVVPTAGGEARNISAPFDLHFSTATYPDVDSGMTQTAPAWSLDGRFVYAQATLRGDQPLLAVPVNNDTEDLERIIDQPGAIGGFSLDNAQTKVAALWGFLASTGQVALQDLESGRFSVLTDFNQQALDALDLGHIEELVIAGPDGDLQGWILTPPDFDPNEQYPSILEIHGGPQTQYGRVFMHEFYFLAALGYVVHWCNPRGSQGYGEAFSGAILGAWGGVDYADIMAWTGTVAGLPYIDPQRMGVAGGSYGGYMTGVIIGRTNRFKAAVAQRVVSNLLSFYASSDLNIHTEALVGLPTPPWDDPETYWRLSPISGISGATTPTLVMHSEQDNRCDPEQGEQLFVALQKLGVESELIMFPAESHDLSRQGRVDRRVARLLHMARWFEKHLKQA
ncbi:MAG: S9 family peptidase [Candidatus Promineifilaceae bacterium]